ncbi:hypothetical protein [Collimonas silvisoli]|uniref:hypothetical protein n=1 Tax=Collimonas silvisoli TaxID=2825884 RepID=UPI001B8CB3DD|nr:hypothetical protein [Collimonas silvisoli]
MSDFRLWPRNMRSANIGPRLDFVQPQTRSAIQMPLVLSMVLMAAVLAFLGQQFWTPREAGTVVAEARMNTWPTENVRDLASASVTPAPAAEKSNQGHAEENNQTRFATGNIKLDEKAVDRVVSNNMLTQDKKTAEIKVRLRQRPAPRVVALRTSPSVDYVRAVPALLAERTPAEERSQQQQPIVMPEVSFRHHVRLIGGIPDGDATSSNNGK